jgi:NAD(P)-dependent dehydrogenase (short-subunit alcohol dehydrogenase family)
MSNLAGKVAVVTGASRGVGRGVALGLGEAGATVYITGRTVVVSLHPGLVRTENVMRAAEFFDLSNSESPQFIGRAVAALAADPSMMEKSGQVLIAATLAQEYSFTDIDGKQPRPLTLEEA